MPQFLWAIIRYPFYVIVGTLSIGLFNILPYLHWLILGVFFVCLLIWIYKSNNIKQNKVSQVKVKVLPYS